VSKPMLLDYFADLTARSRITPKALSRFVQRTARRYNEGTLTRLLAQGQEEAKEAALLALRFIGSMKTTPQIIPCLRDQNEGLRRMAETTLWSIWFRHNDSEQCEELQRLAQFIAAKEYRKALIGLNRLIKKAPHFAEAYNQRAILYWQKEDYTRALADCRRTLELNPYHFGAQSGMAQCLLALHRPVEALAAFRKALKINPNLSGIQESIQKLEQFIEEEGLS
jgi:tetratricopeptide (TPR) repeat protein